MMHSGMSHMLGGLGWEWFISGHTLPLSLFFSRSSLLSWASICLTLLRTSGLVWAEAIWFTAFPTAQIACMVGAQANAFTRALNTGRRDRSLISDTCFATMGWHKSRPEILCNSRIVSIDCMCKMSSAILNWNSVRGVKLPSICKWIGHGEITGEVFLSQPLTMPFHYVF